MISEQEIADPDDHQLRVCFRGIFVHRPVKKLARKRIRLASKAPLVRNQRDLLGNLDDGDRRAFESRGESYVSPVRRRRHRTTIPISLHERPRIVRVSRRLLAGQGYRTSPRMVRAKSSDHPDRFRFRLIEISGRAERGTSSASFLRMARLSGPPSHLFRARSSSKRTSRTQCRQVSIRPRTLTSAANGRPPSRSRTDGSGGSSWSRRRG